MILILIASCSKEQPSAFVIPSTYRYNSPNLDSKQVYVIDSIHRTFRKLNDTLGTFNRGNKQIADSLNFIIQHEFLQSMIHSIVFESADKAKFLMGRLDTTGMKSKIILLDSIITNYTMTGNQVIFSSFPNFYFNINNSFEELNFCQEFTLRSVKVAPDKSEKKYYKRLCSSAEPNDIIRNIVTADPAVRYDTISLEYLNYIFSRY
jgi:hypothetical protein